MSINCQIIHDELKSNCSQFGDAVGIRTPFNNVNNAPIYAYFKQVGNQILITDDGDTIFESFSHLGVNKKRFITTATHKAESCGVICTDGIISILSNSGNLKNSYEKFLLSCVTVIKYTEESLGLTVNEWEIINDVERIIAARNPNATIEKNVTVTGIAGIEAKFPLKANNTLIDAIKPNFISTGSVMRKSAAVEKAGYAAPLIVIDDQEKPDLARKESEAISALCRTILFSELNETDAELMLE